MKSLLFMKTPRLTTLLRGIIFQPKINEEMFIAKNTTKNVGASPTKHSYPDAGSTYDSTIAAKEYDRLILGYLNGYQGRQTEASAIEGDMEGYITGRESCVAQLTPCTYNSFITNKNPDMVCHGHVLETSSPMTLTTLRLDFIHLLLQFLRSMMY